MALVTLAIFLVACSALPSREPAAAGERDAPAPSATRIQKSTEPNWAYAQHQLELANFTAAFIKDLKKNYDPKGFEEVVRLNVLLFLKKSDVHGPQITDHAVSETALFLKANKSTLDGAAKRYGVSAKVIASLLWLESRYGKNSGHYHVPSVFLHLVQSTRPDVQTYLLTQTDRYTESVTADQKKISSRELTKKLNSLFKSFTRSSARLSGSGI